MSELWTCHLGTVEYREAVALQERLRARVQSGELPDLLLLLQHPPVYTTGRRSEAAELPLSRDIDVVETERGGKLTYHGPGQLVGYPIMHVPNVRAFVETMEGALVAAVGEAGVPAATREGREFTGVWVGDRKIGSIGIHVSRRVSMHGFAVNVDNDLSPFGSVIACGLPDVRMTSLRAEGVAARGRDHEGPAYTGVWVEDRKIASIGVHLSKGVTAHGFAVNVDNDVTPFHQVTACGLPDVRMTSIALETGRADGLACFRRRMAYAYAQAHGLRQRIVTPARLEAPIPSMA